MQTINQKPIYFMERNFRGAWVVYGCDGVKQYYGYTKEQARKKYLSESPTITCKR